MFTDEEWKRELVYAVIHKGKKNPIEKQYFHWMGIFLLKRIETGQKESKLQIPIQVAPLARDWDVGTFDASTHRSALSLFFSVFQKRDKLHLVGLSPLDVTKQEEEILGVKIARNSIETILIKKNWSSLREEEKFSWRGWKILCCERNGFLFYFDSIQGHIFLYN